MKAPEQLRLGAERGEQGLGLLDGHFCCGGSPSGVKYASSVTS